MQVQAQSQRYRVDYLDQARYDTNNQDSARSNPTSVIHDIRELLGDSYVPENSRRQDRKRSGSSISFTVGTGGGLSDNNQDSGQGHSNYNPWVPPSSGRIRFPKRRKQHRSSGTKESRLRVGGRKVSSVSFSVHATPAQVQERMAKVTGKCLYTLTQVLHTYNVTSTIVHSNFLPQIIIQYLIVLV